MLGWWGGVGGRFGEAWVGLAPYGTCKEDRSDQKRTCKEYVKSNSSSNNNDHNDDNSSSSNGAATTTTTTTATSKTMVLPPSILLMSNNSRAGRERRRKSKGFRVSVPKLCYDVCKEKMEKRCASAVCPLGSY